MQPPTTTTTTILTLLLLSAGALTHPTSTIFSNHAPLNETSTTSPLDKRSNYGWLSSYAPHDYTCKGGWGGARPKVRNDCIPFRPVSDNVGINWGSWPLGFAGLDIFTDEHCKVFAGKTILRPDFDSEDGPGSCVSVRRLGAKWGSVKSHDVAT